ncbi:transmembrane protein 42a [Latimeria chalumnae]|uniref:transmembrane protein 42a n=1 Tax=Latimeria chalumnae TaxID=7897 RepID=UPI0006D8DEE7|nr:PREDICTED: transmembrane protein 42 [Latimeria chalumnae]|eukprot:XP_014345717.1 PREDICTED: transmembrane protein 42 [Latimeria chalumnae]
MFPSGVVFSALAGLLGALASCCAKLALGADSLKEVCERAELQLWAGSLKPDRRGAAVESGICTSLHVVLRLGCGGLVFACNAMMWTFFAKALRYSSSSARATVTTTASNFISSAIFGKLLFGESHALLWWIGITVTLCGLLLLYIAAPQVEHRDTEKKET